MLINDADAEASRVLGRMRLDGLDRVTVPFDERFVHAWQRAAPRPGMDGTTLVNVLWVRYMVFTNWRAVPLHPAGAGALPAPTAAGCSPAQC